MSRLPQVGGDDGTWGTVLNDFLAVEHNADGTLKKAAQIAGKADDSAVVHKSGAENVGGTKTFQNSPVVPTPTLGSHAATKDYVDNVASSGAPDADASTKGLVQLTGDLGGTASSPTVPGLTGKAPTTRSIATTNSLTGGGDLSADRTLSLVGDSASPGNSKYYGTDGSGSKGFHDLPTGGGAVDSVNGQSGSVTLDADDIDDAATTHKFASAAQLSKLDGIAAGAEVNVNADWNAVSGDAQILNKPTLGTAAAANSNAFATAAQGALADSAIQPGDQLELTDSDADTFASVRIHHDGSATGSWPERLVFWMETGNNTNVFRRTGYFNEYGELRVSPGRSNTVPLRVFTKEQASDPARNMGTALIQAMDNRDDRNELFAVMPDGSVTTVGDIDATGNITAANHISHHPTILDHDDSAAGIPDGVVYYRLPAP